MLWYPKSSASTVKMYLGARRSDGDVFGCSLFDGNAVAVDAASTIAAAVATLVRKRMVVY